MDSNSKSLGELNKLVNDVILADDFKCNDFMPHKSLSGSTAIRMDLVHIGLRRLAGLKLL